MITWAQAARFVTPDGSRPPAFAYLWTWFGDLSTDRDMGMAALGFIKSSEYESWARLNQVEIEPAELMVLKALDRAFVAQRSNGGDGAGPAQAVSSHPMTPELFDSLFK